jgi:type II secretory pathway pseudopilin PulG
MGQLQVLNKKGQSLIELLLVIALAALLMPPIFTGYMSSREGKAQQKQRLLATSLMKETQEQVRNIREKGWDFIAPTGTYHPAVSGSGFSLSPGSTVVNGFGQQVVVDNVYRNSGGAIVLSPTPGILDPSTKKLTTTISWSTPRVSSVDHITYMTRFRDNLPYTETTKAQFNNDPTHLSIFDKTAAVNTVGSPLPGDGEVDMGLGGLSDWCDPNLSIAALDLPKNGVANAISAIEGRVFAGTGENSSGVSFANIAVSNTYPPTSSILGTADGFKTNAVFGESNYAYLATDNNAKEVSIIDLTQQDPVTKKYSEIGYYNAPGNGTGASVYVSGNIGFMTDGNYLYTFDVSSKTGSRPQLGSRQLAGNGTKVVVNGSYAFISIAGATQEMQIVQFSSDGRTLTIVGSADVNGAAAYDVSVNSTGTRAYLATGADSNKREFFIINTSSKNGNRPTIGSYEANGMNPKAVTIVTGNKAILVGVGGEEYQVIDISNESSPVRCGGFNVDTGIRGISSVLESDNEAYSYIITGDATSELKIIEGGPGGSFGYNGTYTSAPFDSDGGFTHAFNRFVANVSEPTQTTISIQVAVANAGSNGCLNANYTFIGPDSTDYLNSYFQPVGTSIIGQIPLTTFQNYVNPGRCFKYKAYLNTPDSSRTPALLDMSINYSP